ncbi:MAG TPA: YraN family protein [Ferruginibacter sp.]|jgi:putative endonuclease|nr:YraN family protein [Ferruginibacter sp.]
MAHHNLTGNTGEGLAVEHLAGSGYRILHQNWRYSHWEIDIIAEKDGILHFIEVKTRRTKNFGYPEDSVDERKIRNLINAAEEYLYQEPHWKRIQFNILSITMLKGEPVGYFLIEDVYL